MFYNTYITSDNVIGQGNMNTYNITPSNLVEDFINTFDLYLEQPEHLLTPADLARFLAVHHLSAQTDITQTMLEEARLLRDDLRAIWTSPTIQQMTTLLNPLLAHAQVVLQLLPTADNQFQMIFNPPNEMTPIQQLAFQSALGILEIVQTQGVDRMRACAANPCQDVFVDTSRNKSRRFCSERCANRYNIAVFRDRQKGNGGE